MGVSVFLNLPSIPFVILSTIFYVKFIRWVIITDSVLSYTGAVKLMEFQNSLEQHDFL